jgi:hypothetical protein
MFLLLLGILIGTLIGMLIMAILISAKGEDTLRYKSYDINL